MRTILLAFAILGTAAAAHAEALRDVAYFTSNPKERAATLARCNNNPGRLAKAPNCINARQSYSRAMLNPANTKMSRIK